MCWIASGKGWETHCRRASSRLHTRLLLLDQTQQRKKTWSSQTRLIAYAIVGQESSLEARRQQNTDTPMRMKQPHKKCSQRPVSTSSPKAVEYTVHVDLSRRPAGKGRAPEKKM